MEELYRKFAELAIAKKASDIFIEPKGSSRDKYQVSIKVRNCLEEIESIDYSEGERVINFIKIKGRISSDGLGPKEGYFSEANIAFRVTLLNGYFGQVLSLRTIYREPFKNIIINTQDCEGRNREILDSFKASLMNNSSLNIICGQPSQGKTTTMFHLLDSLIEEKSIRIISYEEPVEFVLDSILQFNRDEFKGIDVKTIYKYLLRMSPDLIAIGEIRDEHDWDLALRIQKSGIPVLSTLHGGSIEQVQNAIVSKNYSKYNILFQSLKKGKSPEFQLISD
ncbi:Flp pilus assembly complex ATPase component TadA [bacterium]|nr:Flp pilus assembly complex ATPase component TadA [bacterium]